MEEVNDEVEEEGAEEADEETEEAGPGAGTDKASGEVAMGGGVEQGADGADGADGAGAGAGLGVREGAGLGGMEVLESVPNSSLDGCCSRSDLRWLSCAASRNFCSCFAFLLSSLRRFFSSGCLSRYCVGQPA